jgi:hypothetical protein
VSEPRVWNLEPAVSSTKPVYLSEEEVVILAASMSPKNALQTRGQSHNRQPRLLVGIAVQLSEPQSLSTVKALRSLIRQNSVARYRHLKQSWWG